MKKLLFLLLLPTFGFCGSVQITGSGSGSLVVSGGTTLLAGSTNYIQNTQSLQSGATFYVSSGSISGGQLTINTAKTPILLNMSGANQTGIAGVDVEDSNGNVNNYGFYSNMSGGGSSVFGYYTTITGTATKNVGAEISVTGGTNNYGIEVLNGQVQINSSMTVNGPFRDTATIILGGSNNSVTISSNAILGSTTFYGNGPILTNGLGYIIGSIVNFSSFTVTASSSTTSLVGYSKTLSCATINPKKTSDIIKIRAYSSEIGWTNGANVCYASILRGNTDLSSSGFGFCSINNGSTSVPCTIETWDSPNTLSATTYCVALKLGAAGTCVWDNRTNDSTIYVEDFSQ